MVGLRDHLAKSQRKPVQHPGIKGGHGYYNDHGEWVYGIRPYPEQEPWDINALIRWGVSAYHHLGLPDLDLAEMPRTYGPEMERALEHWAAQYGRKSGFSYTYIHEGMKRAHKHRKGSHDDLGHPTSEELRAHIEAVTGLGFRVEDKTAAQPLGTRLKTWAVINEQCTTLLGVLPGLREVLEQTPLRLELLKASDIGGRNTRALYTPAYGAEGPIIFISPKYSDSLVHEIGHYLDNTFSGYKYSFYSQIKDSPLYRLVQAIRETDSYQQFARDIINQGYHNDNLEVFARFFDAWVTYKTSPGIESFQYGEFKRADLDRLNPLVTALFKDRGLVKSLLATLGKSQHVQRPGSRGGHPWWNGKEWIYGPRPKGHHNRDLKHFLLSLRPQLAEAANKVLDDWQQDSEGYDEEFGSGGACDAIAREIGNIIAQHGHEGVSLVDGGQDGDDHAYLIVHDHEHAYAVDIPPGVYETGGGYSWKKIEGAHVEPGDVDVYELSLADIVGDEGEWDAQSSTIGAEGTEPIALEERAKRAFWALYDPADPVDHVLRRYFDYTNVYDHRPPKDEAEQQRRDQEFMTWLAKNLDTPPSWSNLNAEHAWKEPFFASLGGDEDRQMLHDKRTRKRVEQLVAAARGLTPQKVKPLPPNGDYYDTFDQMLTRSHPGREFSDLERIDNAIHSYWLYERSHEDREPRDGDMRLWFASATMAEKRAMWAYITTQYGRLLPQAAVGYRISQLSGAALADMWPSEIPPRLRFSRSGEALNREDIHFARTTPPMARLLARKYPTLEKKLRSITEPAALALVMIGQHTAPDGTIDWTAANNDIVAAYEAVARKQLSQHMLPLQWYGQSLFDAQALQMMLGRLPTKDELANSYKSPWVISRYSRVWKEITERRESLLHKLSKAKDRQRVDGQGETTPDTLSAVEIGANLRYPYGRILDAAGAKTILTSKYTLEQFPDLADKESPAGTPYKTAIGLSSGVEAWTFDATSRSHTSLISTTVHERAHVLDRLMGPLSGTITTGKDLSIKDAYGDSFLDFSRSKQADFQAIYRHYRDNRRLWWYMRTTPAEMFAEGFNIWNGTSDSLEKTTLQEVAPHLHDFFDTLYGEAIAHEIDADNHKLQS